MLKITSLIILLFISSCATKRSNTNSEIDFSQVIDDQNLSDSEKIIELKIALSRQEDKINNLENNVLYFENAFDSLKKNHANSLNYLNLQIDSFKIEQSLLIGPEFSKNITQLKNKVNILEDRAFFMDSLYFSLVTDMVIIENQINSLTNSIDEIEFSNSITYRNVSNKKIDFSNEYQAAHQYYMQGNYEKSLNKFQNLIDNGIPKDLADNCQFWIAQIYFIQNKYETAVVEFNKVMSYLNTNKAEDTIYKMGLCYIKLNQNDLAINAFNELVSKFPKSKYYNKSNEFIINLK
tara:strand:+ start:122 stop:1000 length:879 start_codon:yes stop_codon:yes gene_type:complete